MSIRDDGSSDSDDDRLSEIETSVQLGIPEGELKLPTDATDAAVSRIGGRPAFLPSNEPAFSSCLCKLCSNPSNLLVQLWCPFENSAKDRALYVWGCSRAECQGKHGSIRAWRGLRHNDDYAAKLEVRKAKKRSAGAASARAVALGPGKRKGPNPNPFSMTGTSTPEISDIFGNCEQFLAGDCGKETIDVSDTESDSSTPENDAIKAVASITLAESPWTSSPSYPPVYLSTVSEYIPPPPRTKTAPNGLIIDSFTEAHRREDARWAAEAYENSVRLDQVFERFLKRVGFEGRQCIRYELNGIPLPYSSGPIFESLFPPPPATTLLVTKAAFSRVSAPKREYFPTSLAPCPSCRSKRVFECQLMPNLINVLRTSTDNNGKVRNSEAERRKAIQRALRRNTSCSASGGLENDYFMEWGTCMVFSCEKDCCLDECGVEDKECWREEVVLVQASI